MARPWRNRSLVQGLRVAAKGHRITGGESAIKIGLRDRLDSAKQKVSRIRTSQIELNSQPARNSRSRSVLRIKGKDRGRPSQVSCGTYSRPLHRVSLQTVCVAPRSLPTGFNWAFSFFPPFLKISIGSATPLEHLSLGRFVKEEALTRSAITNNRYLFIQSSCRDPHRRIHRSICKVTGNPVYRT